MTYGIYLTHPQVQIDPAVPVPDWGLSEIGRERAACTPQLPFAREIRHVFSSAEKKAIETAEIFASPFGLAVGRVEAMHENDRSATGFLPPEEFERVADQFFAAPGTSVRGWERAADAQARIVAEVGRCLSSLPQAEPVLFAGHGGVGTLLKCHLMGIPIARSEDQHAGGGCWFRFDKAWLCSQNAPRLTWAPL